MPTYYTRTGDDGTTGLLGKGRVPKYDLVPEVLGTIDEATAFLGLARANSQMPETGEVLLKIQRDLYRMMTEVAATVENVDRFQGLEAEDVGWLEAQIEQISQGVNVPKEFIVPGDSQAGAALDLARAVVRRAERRMAELAQRVQNQNPVLLRYLNRLSSLLFVLELRENQGSGKNKPTLAKTK